jgi:hypothetical protein
MRCLFFVLTLVVILVSAAERACNNSPTLCGISYDEVTHLGAHDSPFLSDASTGFSSFGNQFFNSTVQLDAGDRLLTAQVHASTNPKTKMRELHLCHTSCALFDVGPFSRWLLEIRLWLDRNPNEVVTLVLVNYQFVSAREIQAEYSKADLAHYGYVPPNVTTAPPPSSEFNKTWPTLGNMIDKGERLVTFINALAADRENAPYLLNAFDFVWENAYAITSASAFTCTPDRPSNTTSIAEARASGKLFLMNHLLYWQQAFGIQLPDRRVITSTNSWDGPGGLGAHIRRCADQVGRQPTFVIVDFFNIGPAIKSVDVFNKLKRPVGRISVSDQVLDNGLGLGGKRISGSPNRMTGAPVALIFAVLMGLVL